MGKNIRNFSNVLSWLLVFILAIPVIGGVLYFTVPKVKEFTDEKILKIEQSADGTETDSDDDSAEVIAELQQELSANQTIIANLNTELEKQRVEVTKLQNEAKASEELVRSLQTSISEKQSELNSVVAEKQALETQKEEILAEIEAKEAELEQLQANVEADAETIANLKSDIEAKQAELSELETQAAADQATISSLQSDLETKQAELEALQNSAETDAETIANLEKNIEEIQAELDELENKSQEDAETISNLQSEVTAKQNTITELETRAAEDAETIETLESEKSQYQQLYDNALDNIHKKDAQIIELDSEINGLKEERDTALADLTAKQAELDEANATISSKENEIVELEERVQALEESLNYEESEIVLSDLLEKENLYGGSYTFTKVSVNEFLVYSTNNIRVCKGIYLYNSFNNQLTQIYDSGYGLNRKYLFEDGSCLLYSSYDTIYNAYYYNAETKEIFSMYNFYSICLLPDNTYLLMHPSRVFIFDKESGTTGSSLGCVNYFNGNFSTLPSGDVVMNTSGYGSKCLNIFRYSTKTIEQVTSSVCFLYSCYINNNRVLLRGSDGAIYIYDDYTGENTLIEGYTVNSFIQVNSEYTLLISPSYVYLFNNKEESISKIYTGNVDSLYCSTELDTGKILYGFSNGLFLLDLTNGTFSKIDSLIYKTMINYGAYVHLYYDNNESYFEVDTDKILSYKPVILNFEIITKNSEGNIIQVESGTPVTSSRVIYYTGSVEVTDSGANTGYYLTGIYTDSESANLLVDWLNGETTINYSDVSSLINTETNTITLYAVYEEVSEENNPGQDDKENNDNTEDEELEPGN